jgi:hypothetical protein
MNMKNKISRKKKKGWGSRFMEWVAKGQSRSPGQLCGQ